MATSIRAGAGTERVNARVIHEDKMPRKKKKKNHTHRMRKITKQREVPLCKTYNFMIHLYYIVVLRHK